MPAVSLTTLASGAVVADFGKVYAAVPTVRFHHGRGRPAGHHAGRLPARRAGRRPAVHRRAGPGVDGARHPAHRHELQLRAAGRGGGVPPLRLSGVPLLPDRRPRGGPAAPADVVALARHTAMPDQAAGHLLVVRGHHRRRVPTGRPLGALHRPGAVHRHPDPGEGLRGCWTASTSRGRPWRRSGSRTSPASRCSSSPSPRSGTGPTGPSTRSTRPVSGALDINESTEIYAEWVWQYWMHTGDRALLEAVYPVLRNIADYVQRAVAADDRTGDLAARHQRLLRLPGRHPTQRAGGQRVPPGRRTWAHVLGRPAGEVARPAAPAGGPDRGGQPPADPSRRHLRRRAPGRRQPDADRLADRQRLCRGLRRRAGYGPRRPWPPTWPASACRPHPRTPARSCGPWPWPAGTPTWWPSWSMPPVRRLGQHPGPGGHLHLGGVEPLRRHRRQHVAWLGSHHGPRDPAVAAWACGPPVRASPPSPWPRPRPGWTGPSGRCPRPGARSRWPGGVRPPADPRFSVDVWCRPTAAPPCTVPTTSAGHEPGITEGGRPIRGVARGPSGRGERRYRPPRAGGRHLPDLERRPAVSSVGGARAGGTARAPDRTAHEARPGAWPSAALLAVALVGPVPPSAGASPAGPISAQQLAAGADHACIVNGRPAPQWPGRPSATRSSPNRPAG